MLMASIAAVVSAYAVSSTRRAVGYRSMACSRNSMPFIVGIRKSASSTATRSPRSFISRSASSACGPDSARTIR